LRLYLTVEKINNQNAANTSDNEIKKLPSLEFLKNEA
jgi:hypothetical protein